MKLFVLTHASSNQEGIIDVVEQKMSSDFNELKEVGRKILDGLLMNGQYSDHEVDEIVHDEVFHVQCCNPEESYEEVILIKGFEV